MAEGGHEWWELFVSFFCSFWPPRGVGVQNPLLAITSIYLLFCLHPLYLLFLFGGIVGARNEWFFGVLRILIPQKVRLTSFLARNIV
jgi:hypothetical protein